jgi:hypothetical protein
MRLTGGNFFFVSHFNRVVSQPKNFAAPAPPAALYLGESLSTKPKSWPMQVTIPGRRGDSEKRVFAWFFSHYHVVLAVKALRCSVAATSSTRRSWAEAQALTAPLSS